MRQWLLDQLKAVESQLFWHQCDVTRFREQQLEIAEANVLYWKTRCKELENKSLLTNANSQKI